MNGINYTRYAGVAKNVEHWSPKPKDMGRNLPLVPESQRRKIFMFNPATVLLTKFENAEAKLLRF